MNERTQERKTDDITKARKKTRQHEITKENTRSQERAA